MTGSVCLTFSVLDRAYFSWQKPTSCDGNHNRNDCHRTWRIRALASEPHWRKFRNQRQWRSHGALWQGKVLSFGENYWNGGRSRYCPHDACIVKWLFPSSLIPMTKFLCHFNISSPSYHLNYDHGSRHLQAETWKVTLRQVSPCKPASHMRLPWMPVSGVTQGYLLERRTPPTF